ncbi:hypothetical protein [Rhodopila sp.]|uniref:hypothetical protein n=1 Tax=Rhodopila sp. TaxID=2480087 RepID=UPI003D104019
MSSLSKRSLPAHSGQPNIELTDRLVDRVVARIAPFFDPDPSFHEATAREAARELLNGYNAATGKELQLAAQIAAFSMAVLDCLRCSMSQRGMPVQVILRMRNDAVKLDTMSAKSTKALEARQRERARGQALGLEATQFDEAEFNAAIGKARDMVTFARAKLEAHRDGHARTVAAVVAPARSAPPPAADAIALPPLLAEQMTPQVPARRKNPDPSWASALDELARMAGQTRH